MTKLAIWVNIWADSDRENPWEGTLKVENCHQVKKLKRQFKMMHSKAGMCIDDATKSYDELVKTKKKVYDLNLAKCWHDEKEAAELSE